MVFLILIHVSGLLLIGLFDSKSIGERGQVLLFEGLDGVRSCYLPFSQAKNKGDGIKFSPIRKLVK